MLDLNSKPTGNTEVNLKLLQRRQQQGSGQKHPNQRHYKIDPHPLHQEPNIYNAQACRCLLGHPFLEEEGDGEMRSRALKVGGV